VLMDQSSGDDTLVEVGPPGPPLGRRLTSVLIGQASQAFPGGNPMTQEGRAISFASTPLLDAPPGVLDGSLTPPKGLRLPLPRWRSRAVLWRPRRPAPPIIRWRLSGAIHAALDRGRTTRRLPVPCSVASARRAARCRARACTRASRRRIWFLRFDPGCGVRVPGSAAPVSTATPPGRPLAWAGSQLQPRC
jgi:hypothetical protein